MTSFFLSLPGAERLSHLALATLLLGLTACAPIPPYQPPAMDIPAAFREADAWRAASGQADQVPDAWWQLFNDPVLNQLQTELAVGNETLKNNLAQYQAARAALDLSRSALAPTVGVNAGASNGTSGGVAGAPVNTAYSVAASASWELDVWGRLSGGVNTAQARLQASQDDLAAARLSLQATLAQSYFALRTAEAQGSAYENAVAAYQRSLSLTQYRFDAGIASSADVAQAKTQLQTTKAQLIEIRNTASLLEHAIAVLLGKPPASFRLPPTAALPSAPTVPLQLPARLIERRPDIAAAERRVAAAYAQIGVARTAFFPDFSLGANAGYRGAALAELISAPNLFWSLGPAMALTVFDGGARQANDAAARASTAQAVSVYRQTVLTALQEVEDNLIVATRLEEETAVQADGLVAARKALDVISEQYKAGTVSYLNVVTAQVAALTVERSLLDVRNRRLLALAQLLKNLAGRWEVVR